MFFWGGNETQQEVQAVKLGMEHVICSAVTERTERLKSIPANKFLAGANKTSQMSPKEVIVTIQILPDLASGGTLNI